MSRPRIHMRAIREVLRLSYEEGRSVREIMQSTALPKSTVSDYLKRARQAELDWPLGEDLDDGALEALLYSGEDSPTKEAIRPMPDLRYIRRELKRPHVTRYLLWLEYRQEHPDGYGYTQFCEYYRRFEKTLSPTMRQHHRAGEKTFVDFAGDTLAIYGKDDKVAFYAQIFVAVLGASNLTYIEALENQNLYHTIGAHTRAFAFFGGVTKALVCDNMKTAVTKADRYEPTLNPTYREMAAHFHTTVLPARPYRPRDKAKIEVAVLVAERWVLARLRNRRFHSICEANEEISQLTWDLNHRVTRSLGTSRQELFESIEREHLNPLPSTPYEFGIWKRAKVGIDYHIIVSADKHYYSVPYRLIGTRVDVRIAEKSVAIFANGVQVAIHPRSSVRYGFSTDPNHLPAAHRAHQEWSPSRIINWANTTGPMTAALVAGILERHPHPEQGYRSCLGILRLARMYSPERLEAACSRAIGLHSYSYRSVASILAKGLDVKPLEPTELEGKPGPTHENLRGSNYYQ